MERMLMNLRDLLDHDPPLIIPLHLKLSMLHDAACGVAYLHDRSFLTHRNLSCRKVLLNSGMVAKIADFGSATAARASLGRALSPYMPPEAAAGKCNTASDIFSLGVITISVIGEALPDELLPPAEHDENGEVVLTRTELERRSKDMEHVENKLRACSQLGGERGGDILIKVIEECLNNAPKKRPNIHQVLGMLQDARARIEGDERKSGNFLLLEALQQNKEKDEKILLLQQQLEKMKTSKDEEVDTTEMTEKDHGAAKTETDSGKTTKAQQPPKQKELPKSNATTPSEICELWPLIEELGDLEKKWYIIGLGLGVNAAKLDEIKTSEKNLQDCLQMALRECLKQELTWEAVVRVLSSKAVKENKLAEELCEKYCSSIPPESISNVAIPVRPEDVMTEICETYNLTDEDLEMKCSKQHMLDIAGFISWRAMAERLPGIGRQDINDIDVDERSQEDKRQKLMDLWGERNGGNANYFAIITAMLKAGKRNEAESVCILLKPEFAPDSSVGSNSGKPVGLNGL